MFGGLPDIAAKAAELRPDKLALHEVLTGARLTYGELEARAARVAAVLAGQGVAAGDRVAVLCRNRIAFFELLFACAKLGAILAPLNWRCPAQELRPLIADCEPRLLVYGEEDAATVAELGAACPATLALDDPGPDGYAARVASAQPRAGREWWPAEEAWLLFYTSGTTGAPKAVIHTYAMVWVNYINIGQAVGVREDDTTLNYLPLFHAGGVNLHSLPTLMAGGTVLVLPGFEIERVIDLVADGALTTVFGVPAVYRELASHPRFAALDLSGVRSWACGGAPLPIALVEEFARRGAALCSGMGMTETGPTVFLMDPAHAAQKPGSVGKPQILSRARILTPDGAPAKPGEVGRLEIAGPGVTPGYWRKPQETRDAFTADGWLITGDLARQDEDGYVWIAGRTKEMFISGGENVYPAEVENVLCEHPSVAEACVVGQPDEVWGEVGCAFVIPKPGSTLTGAELIAFCRGRLAGYKIPRRVVVTDDLPRNAMGKVQKHLLPQPSPAL